MAFMMDSLPDYVGSEILISGLPSSIISAIRFFRTWRALDLEIKSASKVGERVFGLLFLISKEARVSAFQLRGTVGGLAYDL